MEGDASSKHTRQHGDVTVCSSCIEAGFGDDILLSLNCVVEDFLVIFRLLNFEELNSPPPEIEMVLFVFVLLIPGDLAALLPGEIIGLKVEEGKGVELNLAIGSETEIW